MQSSARSHLDTHTHHTHWPLTRTCSLSLHLHSLKVSILFWSGKPEKTFSTYKHHILQHRMKAVKQTASEYLGYCVLIGDIIHHTNHISLCGSEKTAWRYYSQKSNVYLTVVASREGTHTLLLFRSGCDFYLDDLISEDFITLLLFCWDAWRQTFALLIIH